MIPQHVIEDILNRVSIIDVIGKYTDVKKSGRNYLALCPFHQEKTPSFSVSEEKGLYHCFGCGASGNSIKFLMDYQKLSFMEALQELAKMASIDLNQFSGEKEFASSKEKETLLKINKESMLFFHNLLLESPDAQKAREYLKKRKLTLEIIKNYRLGYGGKEWNSLTKYLIEKGYREEDAVKAGVAYSGNNGLFDRFKDRVIFPIFDKEGNTAGFGGRILTEDKQSAKYLNTLENPAFHKGSLLFSFNFAKDEMVKKKEALVVEGYMDVIALYQNGIKNAVAPLGTSLTESQLAIIKRYVDSVVFIFDGDEAGINAANRALDISVAIDLNQAVVILPGKKDPYDFAMEHGGEAFNQYVQSKKLAPMDFKLRYFAKKIDVKENKVKFVLSLFPYIMQVNSSIIREGYIKKIAQFIDEDYSVVLSEYQSFLRHDKNTGRMIRESKDKDILYNKVESELISMLIVNPQSVLNLSDIISEDMFLNMELRRIYHQINENPDRKPGELITELNNNEIINKIAEYAQKEEIAKVVLLELAYNLKVQYIGRELAKINQMVQQYDNEANDTEKNKYLVMHKDLKNEEFIMREKLKDCRKELELSE